MNSPWPEIWQGHSLPRAGQQSWSCSSKLSPIRKPPSCKRFPDAQTLRASPRGAPSAPAPCSEHTTPATLVLSHGKLDAFPEDQGTITASSRHKLPAAGSKEELSLQVCPGFTPFPWSCCWPLPDCWSGSAQLFFSQF